MDNYQNYFSYRAVTPEFYKEHAIPTYLEGFLPTDKSAHILDIGCGFGQDLLALKKLGYKNISGIDLSADATNFCLGKKMKVEQINDIREYARSKSRKFDFIFMSHVLEHIKKEDIIDTLFCIRKDLLNPEGKLFIVVPNAQSNTGCYWAYEDFTHATLFTAGSLLYVLRAAGFNTTSFIDPLGINGSNPVVQAVKRLLLGLYKLNYEFWNRITGSSWHRQSPNIFTFDIKVIAQVSNGNAPSH